MKHKRVLITGGSGFIGTALARALASQSAQVFNISLQRPCPVDGVKNYQLDLCDQAALQNAVSAIDPELVFHLAAYKQRDTSLESLTQTLNTNLLGSLNLYRALKQSARGLKHVIVLGTGEEYGNNQVPFHTDQREDPVSPYSLSKTCQTHLGQLMHKLHGLPVTSLRPALAYGPGQNDDMFIPSLIRQLQQGQKFAMSPGDQTREFIYIDDLVQAMILTAQQANTIGKVINIGHGPAIKLKSLAELIAKLLKKESLLAIGARDYRPSEIMHYSMDSNPAQQLLNWRASHSLEQGIAKTIDHFQG